MRTCHPLDLIPASRSVPCKTCIDSNAEISIDLLRREKGISCLLPCHLDVPSLFLTIVLVQRCTLRLWSPRTTFPPLHDRTLCAAWAVSKRTKAWRLQLATEFLALKHESRILGHSSNPVCGFSMMEHVRLCAVWPMENWLGSSLNQMQGWTTVQESYSRALEQGSLEVTNAFWWFWEN